MNNKTIEINNNTNIKRYSNSDDTKFLKTKDLLDRVDKILAQAKQAQAANQTPQNTQPLAIQKL